MPVETHRHYDLDGKLVGVTEIIRESAWDDEQRAEAEALFEAERFLICPKCGNERSVCSDPTRPWYPQRSICYASAVSEQANWLFHEKNPSKRTPDKPGLVTDGTHVWAATEDLTPEDDFI